MLQQGTKCIFVRNCRRTCANTLRALGRVRNYNLATNRMPALIGSVESNDVRIDNRRTFAQSACQVNAGVAERQNEPSTLLEPIQPAISRPYRTGIDVDNIGGIERDPCAAAWRWCTDAGR